jgi:hypothetical protein
MERLIDGKMENGKIERLKDIKIERYQDVKM